MAKYRKRPVVVEAVPFEPGMEDGFVELNTFFAEQVPYINTLEGNHYISPGDYIITEASGERYPIKPDIFAATYEPTDTPCEVERLTALVEKYKKIIMGMVAGGCRCCPSDFELNDDVDCVPNVTCADCWQAALDTANV